MSRTKKATGVRRRKGVVGISALAAAMERGDRLANQLADSQSTVRHQEITIAKHQQFVATHERLTRDERAESMRQRQQHYDLLLAEQKLRADRAPLESRALELMAKIAFGDWWAVIERTCDHERTWPIAGSQWCERCGALKPELGEWRQPTRQIAATKPKARVLRTKAGAR
jgi:hypothetical protein